MLDTTIAHYKITAKIGQGGMGEVYRARDTKLDRDVAIKMLPESVTADADRVARFEREAKVLASFSHPGIAGIYGVEEKDGARFLILEMVEGEDLAQRLQRGPLAIDDALDIARQVADALEAAHDQGIIHRDLKPANIIVTPEGQVKVLDFGLAKALDTSIEGESGVDISDSPTLMTQSPTLNSPTMAGVILGTAAYMSPEQARGKPVDRRADIWAFGVVLYEMLTGARLFEGDTVSDTLAAVLRAEPDYDKLPKDTPPAVRRLLERVLERDKRRRMQAMGEARIVLEDVAAGRSDADATGAPRTSARSSALHWGILITIAVVAIAAMRGFFGGGSDDAAPVRKVVSSIPAPEGISIDTEVLSVAITRDGSRIVFTGMDENRQVHLYVRSLDHGEARQLPGTKDALQPFWSPDGQQVGFSANGALHRIDVDDGRPQRIVDGEFLGAWGPSGNIILSRDDLMLWSVDAAGGELEPWTEVDPAEKAVGFDSPHWLPGGEGLIFTAQHDVGGGTVRVVDADGKNSKVLLSHLTNAVYIESGYLLYTVEEKLMASPFDLSALEVTGDAVQVGAPVQKRNYPFYGFFDAAPESGDIVYVPGVGGAALTELVWVDRAGVDLGEPIVTGDLYNQRLSNDQRRVVVDVSQAETTHGDLWVFDLARGSSVRMTAHPSDESRPVWAPDDSEIYFFRLGNIYKQRVASNIEADVVLESENPISPMDMTADGRTLLYREFDESANRVMHLLDLESGETRVFLRFDGSGMQARLSPDGKWVAYNATLDGPHQIYIESFPGRGERFQVSKSGGGQPIWRGDGRELYYYEFDTSRLMAVPVDMDAESNPIGEPVPLFKANLRLDDFDVMKDGQRFLLNRRLDREPVHELVLIQGWAGE